MKLEITREWITKMAALEEGHVISAGGHSMPGRFLTPDDLISARKATERFNAGLKRGTVPKADKIKRLHHIVCGCGEPGCIFIVAERRE